jgi:hypothetical protein
MPACKYIFAHHVAWREARTGTMHMKRGNYVMSLLHGFHRRETLERCPVQLQRDTMTCAYTLHQLQPIER